MAEPLKYYPTATPTEPAHEELEALIETLHASGTLRVLNGFFGQFDDVMDVTLDQLTNEPGRHAVVNLMILAKGLTHLDPDDLQAVQTGTEKGLRAARESMKEGPPGLLTLMRQLGHPDTRRGLNAMLVFLQTLGRHLRENLDGKE